MHWQLLLQARAMDSQCYVLGAAQQGWHGEKRQTWGHAGATESRGQVLSMIGYEGNGLITVPARFSCSKNLFIFINAFNDAS